MQFPRVACLIASQSDGAFYKPHKALYRPTLLRWTLESLAKSTIPFARIVVSYNGSGYDATIQASASTTIPIQWLHQPEPLFQMVHLGRALDTLDIDDIDWVLFIDDDDLASPVLVETCLNQCRDPKEWPQCAWVTPFLALFDNNVPPQIRTFEDGLAAPATIVRDTRFDHSGSMYGLRALKSIFSKFKHNITRCMMGDCTLRHLCWDDHRYKLGPTRFFHLDASLPLGIIRLWGFSLCSLDLDWRK